MGEYILKILTDILFYLAVFRPLFRIMPPMVRIGLGVIPLIWAVWVKLNWKTRDFMEALPDTFSFQGKLIAGISLLEIFFIGIGQWSEVCAPFVVMFAAVGIMAMKTGRIAAGNQKKGMFWFVCGMEICFVLAAGIFFSSRFFTGSVKVFLGGIYHLLILPVLLLIIQVIAKLLEAAWPYLMQIFSNEIKFQASDEGISINGDLGVELEQGEIAVGAEYFKILGIVFAVAALGLFLWLLYKKLSKTYDPKRKLHGTVSQVVIPLEKQDEEKLPLFGGERNVRYYYRKFLKLCKKRGGWSQKYATSADIHEFALFHWDETILTELRELYLVVRYGGKTDNAEEKKRAREIYKKLKAEEMKKE